MVKCDADDLIIKVNGFEVPDLRRFDKKYIHKEATYEYRFEVYKEANIEDVFRQSNTVEFVSKTEDINYKCEDCELVSIADIYEVGSVVISIIVLRERITEFN